MKKRDIKLGLAFIRMGCAICQEDDKQKNLDLFKASQQRIKARHSEAKAASNANATATTLNADVSEFEGVSYE